MVVLRCGVLDMVQNYIYATKVVRKYSHVVCCVGFAMLYYEK